MKKFISSMLVFALAVSVLFFQVSDAQAATTKSVPSSYQGAIVYKQLVSKHSYSQANWAQDNYYIYLKPAKAREFANSIQLSTSQKITGKVLSMFPGAPGKIAKTVVKIKKAERKEVAAKIVKQAKKGPVVVTYTEHRYGSGFGKVQAWDGKKVNIANNGIEKYKSTTFIKK